MRAFLLAGTILLLVGCRSWMGGTDGSSATADLKNPAGQSVGTARLDEIGGTVRIVLDVKDVAPGMKGVHIHAVGKCEPPSFESAGPHFNPHGRQHGTLNPLGPHAG